MEGKKEWLELVGARDDIAEEREALHAGKNILIR